MDFDRTLHDTDHPAPGHRMGPPLDGAVEAMVALRRRGYQLVVFTTNRIGPVADWLRFFEVPFDTVTNTKPDADAYIDDKAIRHTDWATTMRSIGQLERGLL